MNVFNRLVIIVLLVVIIALAIIVAVMPKESLSLTASFFEWARDGIEHYQQNSWAMLAASRVLIGGGIVLVCLILLWLELRRPRKKTVRVQKLAGGEASITTDSIAQRLAYNIDQLPDVVKVTPQIYGRSRGVDIDLLLETSPEIDVPMKTEEVLQVAREVLEERMGLKLGKVQVKIKHAPFPKE